jgi:hypothetical protein
VGCDERGRDGAALAGIQARQAIQHDHDGLDIFFAAGLVYLSDGFSSPYFLALFLAVITNAVRFGASASIVSAIAISFIYLFIGGSFTAANFSRDANARLDAIGKVFLFLLVAATTGNGVPSEGKL